MPSDRLDELLRVLEMYSFDEGRNRIVEALGAVLDLHRDAFDRTLFLARQRDPELVAILKNDPLVGKILEGYGLVESDPARRVEAALAPLAPLLKEHGMQAKLLAIDGSSASIHLTRPIHGDAASLETMTASIEKALRDELPELSEIKITSAINMAYAEAPRKWLPLIHRFELEGGELRRIQLFDEPVLACDVGGKVFAFYDRCPAGGGSLEGSGREGAVLTCACHGLRFDLSKGRCLDQDGLSLVLLAVSLDDTAVRVAL
jgi:nitrite reductase/ring-hydroxylating ferredoxin subunit/Fe-S cluster biogenesis protein NfuA